MGESSKLVDFSDCIRAGFSNFISRCVKGAAASQSGNTSFRTITEVKQH